jgi:hypothetical protein
MDATNELRFEKTDWATGDFKNPFAVLEGTADETKIVSFLGLARRMHVSKLAISVYIKFDDDGYFEMNGLRCVVVGRENVEKGQLSPSNHVLIINQSQDAVGDLIWERVGVASLSSSVIENNGTWVTIY